MPQYAAEQAVEYAEKVNPPTNFTNDELGSINSWDELALAIGVKTDVLTKDISEYGTGYSVLNNKDRLIDVPFIILDYRFNLGDQGTFVSMNVMTKGNEKLIVNDGSTGIRDQLL